MFYFGLPSVTSKVFVAGVGHVSVYWERSNPKIPDPENKCLQKQQKPYSKIC